MNWFPASFVALFLHVRIRTGLKWHLRQTSVVSSEFEIRCFISSWSFVGQRWDTKFRSNNEDSNLYRMSQGAVLGGCRGYPGLPRACMSPWSMHERYNVASLWEGCPSDKADCCSQKTAVPLFPVALVCSYEVVFTPFRHCLKLRRRGIGKSMLCLGWITEHNRAVAQAGW